MKSYVIFYYLVIYYLLFSLFIIELLLSMNVIFSWLKNQASVFGYVKVKQCTKCLNHSIRTQINQSVLFFLFLLFFSFFHEIDLTCHTNFGALLGKIFRAGYSDPNTGILLQHPSRIQCTAQQPSSYLLFLIRRNGQVQLAEFVVSGKIKRSRLRNVVVGVMT